MIIDARQVEQDARLTAGVCIVGAGAAGITLALELAEKGIEVIVLEGGGLNPDPMTQSLYDGETMGLVHDRLDESRSRYLGGSTNCWGGWCRPMDEIDFETRSWVSDSGWPIRRADMLSFYERSQSWLELGDFDYELEHWAEAFAEKRAELFPLEGTSVQNLLTQLSPPTRFGRTYRARLARATNLRVMLFANAAELITDPSARVVENLAVRTLNGKAFSVGAKRYVLAAGGIENPRLLLASNAVQPMGLGNGRDVVGRYYMDHPRIQSSRVTIPEARRYRALYDATLHRIHRGLGKVQRDLEVHMAPTAAMQRAMQLPNSRTYLVASSGNHASKSYIALKALRRAASGRRHFGYPVSKVLRDVLGQMPALIANAPRTALTAAEVQLGAVLNRRDFVLETLLEPVPNRDSRVTLSEDRDAIGVRKVRVDWRLTEQDRDHFFTLSKLVVDTLTDAGVVTGSSERNSYEQRWPDEVAGCWHHMGTTRMSADPGRGVVDADCKVHGVDNLFVAGSSVFPTCGSDAPTITIIALAVRLADRIANQLRSELSEAA